jgi:hypothetical protein
MTTAGEPVPLEALAAGQGGIVLTGQALACGWSQRRLTRAFREKGWVRVRQGAWAEPGREVDALVRARALGLAHPQLVASHRTAAMLHEIEVLVEGVEFILPSGVGRGRPRLPEGVLHPLPLAAGEVEVVKGVRVTTVPRTLADLLRSAPREEALVAVESALSRRPGVADRFRRRPVLTTAGQIAAALDAVPAGGWGMRAAREWLALADPRAGSPPETVARLRMYDAGLRPEPQVRLVTPGGRVAYPDFLFRGAGLVVEIEGYAWHGSRAQHQKDTIRYNDIGACPKVRRILRFTAADVYNRFGWMIAEIRAALAGLVDGASVLDEALGPW